MVGLELAWGESGLKSGLGSKEVTDNNALSVVGIILGK